jgi:hypothetical protein
LGGFRNLNINCRTAGVFVQGSSHIKNNTPCQDRTVSKTSNNITVISLSDGAGSCSKSEIGAEISTQFVADYLCDNFDDLIDEKDEIISKVILEGIVSHLNEKATDLEITVNEFASTLLFVGVKDDQYLAGHIGDGLIGYFEENETKVLSIPENGEHSNETFFTTTKNALNHFRIYKNNLDNILGFILMSDGSYESLINKSTMEPTKANWDIFSWLLDLNNSKEKIEEALKSNIENLFIKKTIDDCSLNLLSISITKEELPWFKTFISKISDTFKSFTTPTPPDG